MKVFCAKECSVRVEQGLKPTNPCCISCGLQNMCIEKCFKMRIHKICKYVEGLQEDGES